MYRDLLTDVRKTNEIVWRVVGPHTLLGKLLRCAIMDEKKIIHSTNYYFTINVLSIITTENLQASSDEAFIYFLGG